MKGNKLGMGTKFAIFILVVSIIVMFALLNYSSKLQRAKVNNLNNSNNTTKTVQKVDELPNQEGNTSITVKNFNASLADVLYGKKLIGNYKIETYYSGAKFNFNCTSYKDNKCLSGSALLTTDEATLPLYTYDKEEDDYYTHLSDYYIMITDNNIILVDNYVGKSAGKIRLYDKKGNKVSEIKNIITGYKSGDELIDQLYPNLKDNKLSYYSCENNRVMANTVNISNPGVITNKYQINNVKCFN